MVNTLVIESVWVDEDLQTGESGSAEAWAGSAEEAENALTWLSNIGSGAASGAATGAAAGPWGALIGGLVGGGLGAAQTALQQQQRPPSAPAAARPAPTPVAPPAAQPASAPRPTAPAPRPAAATIRPAPGRTLAPAAVRPSAAPRPASVPAPTPASPSATGAVNAADIAVLVTTLVPLVAALAQQLDAGAAPEDAAPEDIYEQGDEDRWPTGEDLAPADPLPVGAPQVSEPDSGTPMDAEEPECDCWRAESDWPGYGETHDAADLTALQPEEVLA